MAKRKTHLQVGGLAGAALAAWNARKMPAHVVALEALGGLIGGRAGGVMPDLIEPAVHPRHRGAAHSAIFGAGGAALAAQRSARKVSTMRQAAAQVGAYARMERDPLKAAGWRLLEGLMHVGAGAAAGTPAGYLSHLVLDATTPRGIPLLN